jgi:hypothetical protein
MDQNEGKWICSNCGTENYLIYSSDKIGALSFACCDCGKVHGSFKAKKEEKSWLKCIPYEGMGSMTPSGVIVDAGTGQTLWGDPKGGGNLSREQYGRKYGWDPWVLYCNVRRNHPVCKNFEDRCNKSREL